MSLSHNLKDTQKQWHGSFRAYMIGFFSSLLLTGTSFALVIWKIFSDHFLIYAIVSLALVQAFIQLRFFLHVGEEDKPKWESLIFYFIAFILLIITLGTLWIMHDLNRRVMEHTS